MIYAVTIMILSVIIGLIIFIFFDIRRKRISKFHTLRSLLIHYFSNRAMYLFGAKAKRTLERDAKTFSVVQEKLLLRILRKNSETSYGKQFKFSGMRSRSDFVKCHPVTRYRQFKDFIGKYTFFFIKRIYCIMARVGNINPDS